MKTPTVLITDGLGKPGIDLLKHNGINVVERPKMQTTDLLNEVRNFDCLLVRDATKVTKEVIEAGTAHGGLLKMIARAGIGTDNIDGVAAAQAGVLVVNAPLGLVPSTAEMAVGLMLAVARNICIANQDIKIGSWNKKALQGTQLRGKTLGILGCGNVGKTLAEIMSGFGMNIIGFDNFGPTGSVHIHYVDTVEELLQESDFISVHANKEVGKPPAIGKNELAQMKETAIIVNTSRGSNIDGQALLEALDNGKIAGAGLDVHENEPKSSDGDPCAWHNKLAQHHKVVATSHLGGSTDDSRRDIATETAMGVISYLVNGIPTNVVNVIRPKISDDDNDKAILYNLNVHHLDVPGVFKTIYGILSDHGINCLENTSLRFNDGKTALTTFKTHQPATAEVIQAINALDNVSVK